MTPLEWLGVVGWFSFTYFQFYDGNYDTAWYDERVKGFVGTPPKYWFGPVWTSLYATLTAGIYLHWADPTKDFYDTAIALYVTTILLNKLWSVFFFRAKNPYAALLIAFSMIVTSAILLFYYGYASSWSSFGLLIPYIFWICYAMYLNYMFMLEDRKLTDTDTFPFAKGSVPHHFNNNTVYFEGNNGNYKLPTFDEQKNM